MAVSARIFDVKHYAVHDGPGIRTTFFLMGCPLRCLWCQNPESQKDEFLITFTTAKCIGCGSCARACGKLDNTLRLPKSECLKCGKCVAACHAGAKQFGSREYTVEDVLDTVMPEKIFFDNSGGGVTFSGGECLSHPEFMTEVLSALHSAGIHTAVDTCGAVPLSTIISVLPYADLFLYDIKKMNPEEHLRFTGMSNEGILSNLKYLCENNANIIIRIPLIPGYTDSEEDIEATASFIENELGNRIIRCELLPYNKLAESKYGNKTIWTDYTLGEYPLEELEPQSGEYIKVLAGIMEKHGVNVFSESL